MFYLRGKLTITLSQSLPMCKEAVIYFVLTHEFNEIGRDGWFLVMPIGNKFKEQRIQWWRRGRAFTIEEVLRVAAGLDKKFQARPIVNIKND